MVKIFIIDSSSNKSINEKIIKEMISQIEKRESEIIETSLACVAAETDKYQFKLNSRTYDLKRSFNLRVKNQKINPYIRKKFRFNRRY